MLCPTCRAEGRSERLDRVLPEVLLRSSRRDTFRDLNGRGHDHSADTSLTEWACRRGHRQTLRKPVLCWCINQVESQREAVRLRDLHATSPLTR